MGGSSGAARAFTIARFRPDLYRRLLSHSGTFVNQQSPLNPKSPHGAWEYHEHLISPHNPHCPYTLMFEHNADGRVAGAPRNAFWKSGAGGFTLVIVPSLDLVIYKMGGNNGQYNPALTGLPQPEPGRERDNWQPIPRAPFHEGSMGGDHGIRRVLEMVCAAVRE